MSVRVSVIGNLGIPKKAKGCRIENPSHRGITLAQLRGFSRKARRAFKKLWPQVPWQDVTTAQVCRHYILPLTEEKNCSYVELVADEPQVPDIFLDYHFSMSFSDIVASLEWFVEAMKLRDSSVLFFNLLGFNQHIAADEIHANSYDQDDNLTIDQCQAECSSILITSGSSDVDPFSGLQRWNMCRAWRLYSKGCFCRKWECGGLDVAATTSPEQISSPVPVLRHSFEQAKWQANPHPGHGMHDECTAPGLSTSINVAQSRLQLARTPAAGV